MATMNLRISSKPLAKGTKHKRVVECLPSLEGNPYSTETGDTMKKVNALVNDNVMLAGTLDQQIIGMRNLVTRIYDNGDGNIKLDMNACRALSNTIVFWFFRLPSNSCLKAVIASSINKIETTTKQIFETAFNLYLVHLITNVKQFDFEISSQLVTSMKVSTHLKALIFGAARCFENNCKTAQSALLQNKCDTIRILECQFLRSVCNYLTNADEAKGLVEDREELIIVSSAIRLVLSLQSLDKNVPLSETFHETSTTLFECSSSSLKGVFDADTRTNLALVVVNEARAKHPEDFIDIVLHKVQGASRVDLFGSEPLKLINVINIINALAIVSHNDKLFGPKRREIEEKGNNITNPAETGLEKIYQVLQKCTSDCTDPATVAAHSMATLNLVKRLQTYLREEKFVTNSSKTDKLLPGDLYILLKIS